jgi:hypothetical protein
VLSKGNAIPGGEPEGQQAVAAGQRQRLQGPVVEPDLPDPPARVKADHRHRRAEFGGGVGVTRPPARSTGKFTADDLTVLLARITAHENEAQQPALPEAA